MFEETLLEVLDANESFIAALSGIRHIALETPISEYSPDSNQKILYCLYPSATDSEATIWHRIQQAASQLETFSIMYTDKTVHAGQLHNDNPFSLTKGEIILLDMEDQRLLESTRPLRTEDCSLARYLQSAAGFSWSKSQRISLPTMTARLCREFDQDPTKDVEKWKNIRFSIKHLFWAETNWCYAKVRYLSPKFDPIITWCDKLSSGHTSHDLESKGYIFYTLEPIEPFPGNRYSIEILNGIQGKVFYFTKLDKASRKPSNSRIPTSIRITADTNEPGERDERQLVLASTSTWNNYMTQDGDNYSWRKLSNTAAWAMRLRSLKHEAISSEDREQNP